MPTATRPKRKRFVVTHMKNGQRTTTDVLAYDRAGAESVARLHKIEPLSVRLYVKGEHVVTSDDYSPTGFRFNTLNCRTAERELGLKWPVRYVTSGHKGNLRGRHRGKVDATGRPYHEVMVKNYLTPGRAGRVIWHELRHCEQAEDMCAARNIVPGTAAYNRALAEEYAGRYAGRRRGTKYRTRRWEVEARATEPNNDRLPLAR